MPNQNSLAQSARAVEYIDCFSAEGWLPTNKFPTYDTKQSDGEVPVMQEIWVIHCHRYQV